MSIDINQVDINQIKKSLKQALELLKIKKVIYIDDAFAQSYSLSEVIGSIEFLVINKGSTAIKEIRYLSSVDFDDPKEIWESEVIRLWEELKPNQKSHLIDLLNKISYGVSQGEGPQDIFIGANIKKILPQEIEYKELSPSKWLNEKETLLGTANQDNKILCFFDQELKYDEEYDSKREGIELLKETLSLQNENIICTLITHLTTIENEIDYWKKLSEDHNLKLSEFLTLSKRRVESNNHLAYGIRLTLLNHKSEILKDYAVEITKQANEYASKELGNINVYDFYHMVLKSSEEEGIWEAQTLFRIHSIFQELESQRLALENGNRKFINDNISLLRGLIGKEISTSNISWEIRRKELFYDESLNTLNLPLQNGDIFYFLQNGKNYILLGQPCDLMIRKSGNRKQKVGILVEIVYDSPKENEKDYIVSIPYFNFETRSGAFVNFKSTISIDLDILDLSIYNDNGKAIFNSAQDLSTFHNPLKKRFEIIKNNMIMKKQKCVELKRVIEESDIEATKQQELIEAILFQAFKVGKDLVLSEITDNGVEFNIVRKGTYRNPYSDFLLEDYSNYISRASIEHDFAVQEVENQIIQKEAAPV